MFFHPFEDMFFPLNDTDKPRSLVIFTAGRSGMENIDSLVQLWGATRFDYAIMHFDDSASEWTKFSWYQHSVAVVAKRQAKIWYFKRFATPDMVKVGGASRPHSFPPPGTAHTTRDQFPSISLLWPLRQGYKYVHFVDSDAGSPPDHPFHLEDYDAFLGRHNIQLGQPGILPGGRSVE